jgi:pyruvate kinase
MGTTPAPAPKQSLLSKIGGFLGKVLGIAQKVEPTAATVAEALLPQFAPEIALANDLFNKIVKQALIAEATAAAAGTAVGTGPQKLAQVLAAIGPDLDAWVANNFPGNKQVTEVTKSGLVNAIVALLNELAPPTTVPV